MVWRSFTTPSRFKKQWELATLHPAFQSKKKRMLHNDVRFNHLKDKKTKKQNTTTKKKNRQTVPTGERSIPRFKISFHPSTHWFSLQWNYFVRVEALLFCTVCQRSHTITVICWQMRRWRFTGHCTKRHVERGQTRCSTWIQNIVTVQEKKKIQNRRTQTFLWHIFKKEKHDKKKLFCFTQLSPYVR